MNEKKTSPFGSVSVKKKDWGAYGEPNGLEPSWPFGMMIPNMFLVLKLDSGKVVPIADEHTQNHPVPYSNIDLVSNSSIDFFTEKILLQKLVTYMN